MLIVLAVLFLVLTAPRTIGSASLEHMQGYHYTHRGYHDGNVNIPENSLSSFVAAIEAGYGIELDVQLSSDMVPMVIHDADLDRICGVQGKVWDYTCAELQQMKLTRLMGAPTSTWTLKDPAHYEAVKGEFDLYTFEGFPMQ